MFFDPVFIKHDTGPGHPESPVRLQAVEKAFETIPGLTIESVCPEADRIDIELVHSPEYVDLIMKLPKDRIVALDADTSFSPGSREASLKAAGAVMEAVKFSAEADNNRAFCAVRPPGHHAEKNKAMGFCIFNNIAIGAVYAVKKKLFNKIAIVDWDAHHGNGTQSAFYSNPDVLYISLHQYPYYPGSGGANEKGQGEGDGYTLNFPMNAGNGDNDFRDVFNNEIIPAIDNFKPELIMISAGFDAHRNDPLTGLNLSSEFYGEMTQMLVGSAKKHCCGRIVSVLEGGYNLTALTESVKYHLERLKDD